MATVINKKSLVELKRVDPSKYNTDEWIINPALPDRDKKYWKVIGDFVVEKNQNEREDFDATVLEETIKTEKIVKNNNIDKKTAELIANGIFFNGEYFSLSQNAQSNWNAIQTAISSDVLTEADFPFEISTLDDDIYMLEWSQVPHFMATVIQTVATHLGVGRRLKKNVKLSTTIEELDQIIDER